MDSVTQFTLGAAVSAAMIGRHIGYRKAVIIGGLMGTVPDLDTFIPHTDPVEKFISHRGPSHSLIMQALVTPVFAEPLVRFFRSLKDQRIRTYAAIYLMLATHALIDAMTIYGTKLLWPLTDTPFGVGSVFIIDPLYTLPLLIVTTWAFFVRDTNSKLSRSVNAALVVSTLYLCLSIGLQALEGKKANAWLAEKGITPERTLTIPTPFNIFYWHTIAIDEDQYLNVYSSTLNDEMTLYRHERQPDLEGCLAALPAYQALRTFTKGIYSINTDGQEVIFSDLRMGLTPDYVFRFHIADILDGGVTEVLNPSRKTVKRGTDGDISWLRAGILGKQVVRLAESDAMINDMGRLAGHPVPATSPCS